MSAIEDNRPRFRPGTDHVESWFVRANDPAAPRAVWLKATVLTKADGTSVAEAWCSVFDGDRTAAFRAGTAPRSTTRQIDLHRGRRRSPDAASVALGGASGG